MSEILCRWLNEDVGLSRRIDSDTISLEFSSGYLIGELLHCYGLQDDFEFFSEAGSADAKLNNFTRMEPTMSLLDIKFDSNMAKEIMAERPGMATRLLYQLFIALGRKTKMNLTGAAMETMRAAGPAKLACIESSMYKERLKTLVPRQVDLDFDKLVEKYDQMRREQEEAAQKARIDDDDRVKKYQQKLRKDGLAKSLKTREKQENIMSKIREATVKIPKPLEQKKQSKNKSDFKEKLAKLVHDDIALFEASLKNARLPVSPQASDQVKELDVDIEMYLSNTSCSKKFKMENYVQPQANEDYMNAIRQELSENSDARKEREKRRRKVLVEQLKAHETQQEAAREHALVTRLMRQSQMERRIAVQLMHVRQQKDVIRNNRIMLEKQYTERRMKDFEDALQREAEMCRLAAEEYAEETKRSAELHRRLATERAKAKYEKHWRVCLEILLGIVDFSCKIGEYRELTEKQLPAKLVREWKVLFLESKPLYTEKIEEALQEDINFSEAEAENQNVLDEEDFMEYKNFVGEWMMADCSEISGPPKENSVLGFVLGRLYNITFPPIPPPTAPRFPEFPIKVCVVGKFFSGKSSVIQRFVDTHRAVKLSVDILVKEAIAAYQAREVLEVDVGPESRQNVATVADMHPVSIVADPTSPTIAEGTRDSYLPKATLAAFDATEGKTEASNLMDSTTLGTGDPARDIESRMSLVMSESRSMLSIRAKLGGKANHHLRKGRLIPDSLLVDMLVAAIRKIPEGTGWILDGFPTNIQQAKLLEKALTGYEDNPTPKKVDLKEGRKSKKSKLVPDPTPVPEVKPPVSGIDVVVLLDIDDNVILRRAEGRTCDQKSGVVYHKEFNPPPDGCYTGLENKSRVQPVIDPANDREQVQTRLTAFQDSWPKLEKWFAKFKNLSKINADMLPDELYSAFATLLEDTLSRPKAASHPPVTVKFEPALEAKPSSGDSNKVPGGSVEHQVEAEKQARLSVETSKPVKEERAQTPNKEHRNEKSSPSLMKKMSKKDGEMAASKSLKDRAPSQRASRAGSRSSLGGSRRSPVKTVPEVVVDEAPVVAAKPSSPEPGSTQWKWIEQPLDKELVEVLLDFWDNVENTYIKSCKHMFRKLRLEKEAIYRYFYATRNSFVQFLMRPDEKQEFVLQWQKEYNIFPEDTRCDDEAKAELHQRVEDLCDRLWDICDARKEEAEGEREAIMNDGWLEDRIGLIMNHYLSLMQFEVDRYQQSCKLLRDYYIGMEAGTGTEKAKIIPEEVAAFARIPLVELPTTLLHGCPSASERSASRVSVKPSSPVKGKSPDLVATTTQQIENKHRIPLVSRRPRSTESPSRMDKRDKKVTPRKEKASEEKMDSPLPLTDADEKLFCDAVTIAMNAILSQNASDQLDDEHQSETVGKASEVPKTASKDKKPKKNEKDRGKSAMGKSKTVISESAPTEESFPAVSEEEMTRKSLVESMKKEYKSAITFEGARLKTRAEAIKTHALRVVQDLKAKADTLYASMDDWLGKRFRQEMKSIEQMTHVIRQAIEKEEKLQDACVLEDTEFFVDDDLHIFKTPTPPPTPGPQEPLCVASFTCNQLEHLISQFKEVAPSGFLSIKVFVDTMIELPMSLVGSDLLPEMWMTVTEDQLSELSRSLSVDKEYVDWRRFVIALSRPCPRPSTEELVSTLLQFRKVCTNNKQVITRDEYSKIDLMWLLNRPEFNPTDESGRVVYDRMKHMKQVYYELFASVGPPEDSLEFLRMLLYFCEAEDCFNGFLRALSVILGTILPTAEDFEVLLENDLARSKLQDVVIGIAEWKLILNHGRGPYRENHRFSSASQTSDDRIMQEMLILVYRELGASQDGEGLSLSLLYQHPYVKELMHSCSQFKIVDFDALFAPAAPLSSEAHSEAP